VFGEPLVDLLGVDVQLKVHGDDVEVRLRYLLLSRAGARQLQLAIPLVMRSVELDGDAPAPDPFLEPVLMVQGKPVKTGSSVEATREQYACGAGVDGMPAGISRAHLLRLSATLQPDGPTTVEVRFKTRLAHDDWRSEDGKVLRSERALCVQLKPPLGFAGLARGRARWDVTVKDVVGTVVVTPGQEDPAQHFHWSADDVELKSIPDLQLRIAG